MSRMKPEVLRRSPRSSQPRPSSEAVQFLECVHMRMAHREYCGAALAHLAAWQLLSATRLAGLSTALPCVASPHFECLASPLRQTHANRVYFQMLFFTSHASRFCQQLLFSISRPTLLFPCSYKKNSDLSALRERMRSRTRSSQRRRSRSRRRSSSPIRWSSLYECVR